MLAGPVKRIFRGGPAGPSGATLAAALGDVVSALKAVIMAPDLPTARLALGLGSAATYDASALPLSTAATQALAGKAASGANADITALGQASGILDTAFGATRGNILVRLASGWSSLPLGANGTTVQSNGTDVVFAAASPGTGALRYDAAQNLTPAQQDQGRVNVGAPVPLVTSAPAGLTAADVSRPVVATGTITVTAAAGANNNWASGEIVNANATSGVVTLAVPSGATLTGLGVSGNALALLPQQRARIIQTGATAYVALWVERSPILIAATLAAAVTSADFALPQGYASYEIALACQVTTAGAGVGLRFSSDGGSTFKAGASDYAYQFIYGSGSSASAGGSSNSFLPMVLNQDAQTTNWASTRATLFQGSAAIKPKVDVFTSSGVESNALVTRAPLIGNYATGPLAVNALRLIASAGSIAAGSTFTVRGVPAQ